MSQNLSKEKAAEKIQKIFRGKQNRIKVKNINIIETIKKVLLGSFIAILSGYVGYLIWIRGIEKGNIYSVLALIGISTMILLNIMKFIFNKNNKYLWRIVFYLFISIFLVLVYINQELIKDCLNEEQKSNFLVYTLIFLGVYLYLYKERSLADCSYLSFSKIIMILSVILSFIHEMNEAFVICLILLFYMNT
mgnify:CR=1 FL=1|jgi:hypothetical protein